jgi:hypothetical protein
MIQREKKSDECCILSSARILLCSVVYTCHETSTSNNASVGSRSQWNMFRFISEGLDFDVAAEITCGGLVSVLESGRPWP